MSCTLVAIFPVFPSQPELPKKKKVENWCNLVWKLLSDFHFRILPITAFIDESRNRFSVPATSLNEDWRRSLQDINRHIHFLKHDVHVADALVTSDWSGLGRHLELPPPNMQVPAWLVGDRMWLPVCGAKAECLTLSVCHAAWRSPLSALALKCWHWA